MVPAVRLDFSVCSAFILICFSCSFCSFICIGGGGVVLVCLWCYCCTLVVCPSALIGMLSATWSSLTVNQSVRCVDVLVSSLPASLSVHVQERFYVADDAQKKHFLIAGLFYLLSQYVFYFEKLSA